MTAAVAMRGTYSRDWMRCSDPNCNTFYDTFIPMPYQYNVLKDSHRRVGVFGGYGCGKTTVAYKADEKHIMVTPQGETLIGASTLIQLENTIKKDLEGDFPAEFVKSYNKQRGVIDFVNAHKLYYRPLEDEGDIKSYNLTRAHLLEASEIKHDAYVQLQTRVRNEHAMKPKLNPDGSKQFRLNPRTKEFELVVEFDWLQMLLESNPDSGWIKTDFLLKSGTITQYGGDQQYNINQATVRDTLATHIIPTKANYNLPPHFYEDLAADKPNWWVRRFLEGSFEYTEGLVYKNYHKALMNKFEIPKHWPIMIGFDYGMNDNSHFVFLALDFKGEKMGHPAAFAFKEIVKNDMNITQLATIYKAGYREVISPGALYKTPVMDAMSFSKRSPTGDKEKIGKLFQNEGCIFNPAQMDKDTRILKTSGFIDMGYLYMFIEDVPHLIQEVSEYKYPERSLIKNVDVSKPIDKNDHGIAALEFAVMELPHRMREMYTQQHLDKAPSFDFGKMREASYGLFPSEKEEPKDNYDGFAGAFHEW